MANSSQPLSIIADVTVITNSPQVSAPPFNKGLFVGASGVIPSTGPNSRTRTYLAATYATAMLTDGFTNNDPEFIFAQIYFSQSPQPQSISIGTQDDTAISAAVPHTGNAGTGYAVGDLITVVQGGASGGVLRVASATSGVVNTLTTLVGQQGTGYAIANGLTTSGGSGTGLEVDITAIGESLLQAFEACRIADASWYCGAVVNPADSDDIAIAAYTQSQRGTTYFFTTADAAVLNGTSGNVLKTIFATSASRTWAQYATTQSGLYPNQIYFIAAVMGQAMASNTQLQNSAFTEKFSGGVPLVGVVTEPLSSTQISNIEGAVPAQGPNGNLFLNYANAFNVLEQGTMLAENVFFDQILNLDILASNIQFAIMDLLTSVPKVPQTDAGQQLLIQAVESALNVAANTGFIAAGTWEGQTFQFGTTVMLKAGQALPNGYLAFSPKYSTLTQAQIQARQAPPIYAAIIEAGAVHFVTIQVLVQV